MNYTVQVDDNYHYMDKDYRYTLGHFPTYEEALAAARAIVDGFLKQNHTPGMTPSELYGQYTFFGDDPFISPSKADQPFSAWTYARQRCEEICSAAGSSTQTTQASPE